MKFEEEAIAKLIDKRLYLSKIACSELTLPYETYSRPLAFLFVVMDIYFNNKLTDEQLVTSVTEGRRDLNFDAIFINNSSVYVFDTSFESIKNDEMFMISNSIKEYFIDKPNAKSLSVVNTRLLEKIKKIEKIRHPKIKIIIARGREAKNTNLSIGLQKIKEMTSKTSNISLEYFNNESLYKPLYISENYLPHYIFEPEKDSRIPGTGKKINECIVKIPLAQVLCLQKECIEKSKDLFSKNIRNFKGETKISTKISRSLKENPEHFHIFHNGITIVASGIEAVSHSKIKVFQPQIVNGCQTISSIYKKYENELSAIELSKANIYAKIVKADEALSEQICQSSNTQNTIQPWDLRSNDNIQKIIEYYVSEVSEHKWFYKRKTGLTNFHKAEEISLPELFQWIWAAKFGQPAKAKNNKAFLFSTPAEEGPYKKIIESLKPDTLSKIITSGLSVRKYIKDAKKEQRGFLRDANLHLIAYIYNRRDYEGKTLQRVENKLVKTIQQIHGEVENISSNKIFTKDFQYRNKKTTLWALLK